MVIQIMHHANHKEVGLTRKTITKKIIEHMVNKVKAHYLLLFTRKMILEDQPRNFPIETNTLKNFVGVDMLEGHHMN